MFECAFCDGWESEGALDGHSLHSAAPREDARGLGLSAVTGLGLG